MTYANPVVAGSGQDFLSRPPESASVTCEVLGSGSDDGRRSLGAFTLGETDGRDTGL
jgi:hypothetical protein